MKKFTVSFLALLTLAILFFTPPMQASTDRGWPVGEWRLVQNYTQDDGQEVTFNGRLRIHREKDRLYGRINFDVVGNWEPLEGVEVTDETISFIRPMYKQKFYGHRQGNRIKGTYRDKMNRGEWEWRAERE
jgi:hypothetical protein